MRIFLYIFFFSVIFLNARVSMAAEVEWVQIHDPRTRQTFPALFLHPQPGQRLPAVIYHHGKIIENAGYEGGMRSGYDVAEFVRALADSGYAAIAPIRSADTGLNFGPVNRGALAYLRDRDDVDAGRLGIMGFSKGGYIALEAAAKMPDFKAVIAMSPARPKASLTEEALANIQAPVLVTLGQKEWDDAIGKNTRQNIVGALERLGKDVKFKSAYNGDHQWFHKVRGEYWQDIVDFLNKYLKAYVSKLEYPYRR